MPLAVAADCLGAVVEAVYGDDLLGEDAANRWVKVGFSRANFFVLLCRNKHVNTRPQYYRNSRAVDKGFRTAPLIRLVGPDDGLLSHTFDGPRSVGGGGY